MSKQLYENRFIEVCPCGEMAFARGVNSDYVAECAKCGRRVEVKKAAPGEVKGLR